MTESLIGSQIGVYAVEEELGRGGMGVVYRAEDLALRRPVALKVLLPHLLDDSAARARFQREIQTTVAIEHPHVVPVYAAGIEDGNFFIAMRFVEGRDLGDLLHGESQLQHKRVLRLIGQVASALYAVHVKGVVHRDIKPQNVLIWNPGEPDEHAFLTDFGIAKALGDVQTITRMGVLGTPGYMAPEVLDGLPATPACDQYALAVVAFELLTGRMPFDDDDEIRNLPVPLAAYARGVPEQLKATIERALSPDPKQRFDDVRAFVMSDEAAYMAFQRSQAISTTVEQVRSQERLVTRLHDEHDLSDAAIAEIADLNRTEVVRLRRQAARRALVGE
jgi:serine/threonine protein kinase